MLENRPIVVITIGYIIGIISGLYCKISIAFIYLILFIIYLVLKKPQKPKFKLISFRRYFRYIKIIVTKKVFISIIFVSILSNTYILYKINEHKIIAEDFDKKTIQIEAIVASNANKKKYKNMYKVKVIKIIDINNNEINDNSKLKNKRVCISVKKNSKIECNCGYKIKLTGIFDKGETRTNYKGFDYREYLETQGLYGLIDVKSIAQEENTDFFWTIMKRINNIFLKIKHLIQSNFKQDESNVLLGILLGYTDNMDEDIKEDFSNSNILHIVAVSGMHVGYIIIFCKFIFDGTLGKRKSYIFSIICLIFYMVLTGLSPSVVRATVMAVLMLFAKIIYKKSDIWSNICLSLLILLIANPFSIRNTGLVLSYLGTIGIIIYSKLFHIKTGIINAIGTVFSVSIFIAPITAVYFNQIPILSLAISIIIGFLVAPIIFLGFIFIFLNIFLKLFQLLKLVGFIHFFVENLIMMNLLKIVQFVLSIITDLLLYLANFGSNIPLNKTYVVTPNILKILIYYFIMIVISFIYLVYKPNRRQHKIFNQRFRNLISLIKYKYKHNKNRVISIFLIFAILFSLIKTSPQNLKIYFIDVGQGDSCLIVTPHHKKILIDGGGSESYDVGKNVLLPYLLDRGIKSLDYIIISHFDSDHYLGCAKIMEELNVKTVIISKQAKSSENFENFKKIVTEKKIKVLVVGKGRNLKIEKDLYFDVLWPRESNLISENVLNNNSIVCKMNYRDFSMLFTGDIEEIAEKQILQEYKNNLQILKSTILKVGHHGSKTSSTQDFVNAVKPELALIGVGKDNKFGHPNEDVIKRLETLRYKNIPYR